MINHTVNKIKNSAMRKIRMLEVRIKELESDKEFYRASLLRMIDERGKIDKAIEEIEDLGKEMDKVQFTKHLVPLQDVLEILKRNIGE